MLAGCGFHEARINQMNLQNAMFYSTPLQQHKIFSPDLQEHSLRLSLIISS
jgi:uncharacterized protein YjbI with pentapeptide repeats